MTHLRSSTTASSLDQRKLFYFDLIITWVLWNSEILCAAMPIVLILESAVTEWIPVWWIFLRCCLVGSFIRPTVYHIPQVPSKKMRGLYLKAACRMGLKAMSFIRKMFSKWMAGEACIWNTAYAYLGWLKCKSGLSNEPTKICLTQI